MAEWVPWMAPSPTHQRTSVSLFNGHHIKQCLGHGYIFVLVGFSVDIFPRWISNSWDLKTTTGLKAVLKFRNEIENETFKADPLEMNCKSNNTIHNHCTVRKDTPISDLCSSNPSDLTPWLKQPKKKKRFWNPKSKEMATIKRECPFWLPDPRSALHKLLLYLVTFCNWRERESCNCHENWPIMFCLSSSLIENWVLFQTVNLYTYLVYV